MSAYDDIVPEEFQVTDAQRLGAIVRELRQARGLTQAELAARAHVSRGYLIRLEKGHPTAELGTILQVLTALGARLGVTAVTESDEERLLREAFERIVDG
ncbi:transcriptional regulator [Nocardia panacis]|uniref:Transcriptional regulator n=1 Tax=Nocardia panacis TaxID=2340916 RepID=A0A3A4K6B2_9NOCA|nr:helix-turn-helix domain-containing protein [Nocardia panacis]RJO70010.1 transcriptional regulator [Nocardia panacis]